MGNSSSSAVSDSYNGDTTDPSPQKNKKSKNNQSDPTYGEGSVITEVEPFDNNSTSMIDDKLHPFSNQAPPPRSYGERNRGGGPGRGMGKRKPSFFHLAGSHIRSELDGQSTPSPPPVAPSSPLSPKVMNKGLVDVGVTRVLVLYCGGTIGMKKDPVKGYLPLKNYLSSFLQSHDRFHDNDYLQKLLRKQKALYDVHSMDTTLGDILMLPHFVDGKKRVAYQIHEMADLKDSCNMVEADYISLAATIELHYHSYDGFLILHGTDTMAYTASALSFLLEDLGKSVVITGSQVPFTELRNDAYENFLGSLILASHYCVPEVTVYFNNNLFRGNRVKKVNSKAFAAFNSPNMKPLGVMGVEIELDWGKIHRSSSVQPFRASRALNSSVVCLRLYPGITPATIQSITSGPVKGLVLETFGSGNAPDDNPPLLEALAEAVKRGVVVVNVTQCSTGSAVAGYAVGYALSCTGVISGRDMTVECALMKLNYLLSQRNPQLSQATVTRLMGESLRGELTVTATDSVPGGAGQEGDLGSQLTSSTVTSTLSSLIMRESLASCPEAVRHSVEQLLRPMLLHEAAARGDLTALEELITRDFDINTPSPNTGRTCLFVAMSSNSTDTVRWLITQGVNVHLRDKWGVTALVYAIRLLVYTTNIESTVECISLLKEAGASLCGVSLTKELLHFARVGNVDVIKMIYECDGALDCADDAGKTLLHIAALHGQVEVLRWVLRKQDLQCLFSQRDQYGKCAVDDAQLLLREAEEGRGVVSVGVWREVIATLGKGKCAAEQCGGADGLVDF